MSALAQGGRVKDWAKDWHIFWSAALKLLEAINTQNVTWSYFEKYLRGHDSSCTWTDLNILGWGSVSWSEEDSIEVKKTQNWTFPRWGQKWHKTFGRTASRSILALISDSTHILFFRIVKSWQLRNYPWRGSTFPICSLCIVSQQIIYVL